MKYAENRSLDQLFSSDSSNEENVPLPMSSVKKRKRTVIDLDSSSGEEETPKPTAPRLRRLRKMTEVEDENLSDSSKDEPVAKPLSTCESDDDFITPSKCFPSKETTKASSLGDDDELSDFIAVEGDDEVELDWRSQLPPEFSAQHTKPMSQVFKRVVHLYAYIAVHELRTGKIRFPPSVIPSYDVSTFKSSLDRLKSMIDSQVNQVLSSAAWDPEFKLSIEYYSEIQWKNIIGGCTDCEACGRRNHLATQHCKLFGTPYRRDILLGNRRGRERREEELEMELDPNDPLMSYDLGRHCATRANSYHQMYHYIYVLYRRIKGEIIGFATNHRLSFAKIRDEKEFVIRFLRETCRSKDVFDESEDDDGEEGEDLSGFIRDEYLKLTDKIEHGQKDYLSSGGWHRK